MYRTNPNIEGGVKLVQAAGVRGGEARMSPYIISIQSRTPSHTCIHIGRQIQPEYGDEQADAGRDG